MPVTIDGTTGITTPDLDSAADLSVAGVTVGRGAGAVSTNTAVGASALAANTTGASNTAVGQNALLANTDGTQNTAMGRAALTANTSGVLNSAFGRSALLANTTGANNTAVGSSSLASNTTASNNTAVGYQAGYSGTTGISNCYFGQGAGYTATTGQYNTYVGTSAGNLTTGSNNQFIGNGAGRSVTTGSGNSIIGNYSGNQNGLDIRTASNYIVLSDGDGNPRMFFNGSGYPFFSSCPGGAGTNALKYNTTTGAVSFDTSSARYKDNIRDSIYGLSHVMQMRSAQFEYKDDKRSDVGLIAEELDLIVPELVGKNKDGEPDSVSYDRMVSVLTKAIQEQQAIITALTARVTALEGN